MAKMSSLGLIFVVVLAVVTVDSAPALNLETRDVAEAAEAYLARLLDNPAVQDFIASLDDDSETVEVSKRGILNLAGHGIAGAANLGENVVRTGAGVVGGLANTGEQLLENLFGPLANFVRNRLQTETRFVDNTARGASDLAGNVVGAADSVFYKRAPKRWYPSGKRSVRLSGGSFGLGAPGDYFYKRNLLLNILRGHLLRNAVVDAASAANDVVGGAANVAENVAGAAANVVNTGIGAAEDVAETAVDAAASVLDKRSVGVSKRFSPIFGGA